MCVLHARRKRDRKKRKKEPKKEKKEREKEEDLPLLLKSYIQNTLTINLSRS